MNFTSDAPAWKVLTAPDVGGSIQRCVLTALPFSFGVTEGIGSTQVIGLVMEKKNSFLYSLMLHTRSMIGFVLQESERFLPGKKFSFCPEETLCEA